ncbi:MAG TPA: hypothetical protein ENI68_05410 [Gammaproteobacteria bacterium]|nr:hypothetical protein [Gammaproteobacteria bacterium]
MFVKVDWSGWLVLTAVVVFPAMLYLTRQGPADTTGNTEHARVKRSGVLQAQSRENKQAVLPAPAKDSARVTPSENTDALARVSDSASDPASRSHVSSDAATDEPVTPRREETDRSDDEITSPTEIYSTESDNPPVESPSGNMATVNYYNVSGGNTHVNLAQETAPAAVGLAATGTTGSTEKQSGSSRVSSPNSVTRANNSILSPLYTAQIDPPQKVKPKCPPVYMGINAYARNMRVAMGCNDN